MCDAWKLSRASDRQRVPVKDEREKERKKKLADCHDIPPQSAVPCWERASQCRDQQSFVSFVCDEMRTGIRHTNRKTQTWFSDFFLFIFGISMHHEVHVEIRGKTSAHVTRWNTMERRTRKQNHKLCMHASYAGRYHKLKSILSHFWSRDSRKIWTMCSRTARHKRTMLSAMCDGSDFVVAVGSRVPDSNIIIILNERALVPAASQSVLHPVSQERNIWKMESLAAFIHFIIVRPDCRIATSDAREWFSLYIILIR